MKRIVPSKMFISCAVCSETGKVRDVNQDAFYFEKYSHSSIDAPATFSIFDGMGGEQYGDIASSLASELLRAMIERDKSFPLDQFIYDANELICDEMQKRKVSRMGSTAAMVRLSAVKTEICNIGDSKVMAFKNGALFKLSQDHRADIKGRKGVLTQHLGIFPEEFELEPYTAVYGPPKAGTIFVLCTDGLTDMVSDNEITELLNSNENELPDTICNSLVDAALKNGGKDNVTVIVIKVE